MPEPLRSLHQSFAQATPTAPSPVWQQMLRGRGDHPHRVIGKCGLHLPAPGLPQGGVAAGIAGKHGHFHPRKPGGQVMAQSLQQGLFGLEHSPDLFVGVQLSALDLQDGLNMEHRRHRSARRGHPAAFPQILQGVHRDVDAGTHPAPPPECPGPPPLSFPGPAAPGRCGWTGPA